ncbi:toll/interleukin-1 receptor domain-containing protein [Actinomycetospora aeridis]|uniref:Toll/interleukin-1 receptor domain-containing protein n=1 Tax=Actinomycetospora aeridis TaxID=3129231 RepID=A0ABU8N6L8_9PSEU
MAVAAPRLFFVSYTQADEGWALWIAGVLEEEGHRTRLQSADSRPGNDFAHEMHQWLVDADHVIAVVSERYYGSTYGLFEMGSALVTDALGRDRRLLPVRVEDCAPRGLLASRVYIDLFDVAEEQAREALLHGIDDAPRSVIGSPFPGGPARRPATEELVSALRVHRVPPGVRGGSELELLGDAFVGDLGAWLGLDRGPSTTVVAADRGASPTAALTAVEDVIGDDPLGARLGVRTWHEVGLDRLGRLPGAEPLGVVVTWDLDTTRSGHRDLTSVRRGLDHVRRSHPDAAIVLVARSADAGRAVTTAAATGRALAARHPGLEVVATTRPGAAQDHGGDSAGAGAAATRLMSVVAAHRRELSLPAPPFPHDADPFPPDTDPEEVASAVVAELDAADGVDPLWGPPAREAEALALVRNHAGVFFPAVTRHHAAERRAPNHWASLLAAAPFDADVDLWWDWAPTVDGSDVPRALRTNPRLVEAAVLAMLRRGEDVTAWSALARNRIGSTWRLAEHLAGTRSGDRASTAADAAFLQYGDAGVGAAAVRAHADEVLAVTPPAPEASAAWWAVLGREPLSPDRLAVVSGLAPATRRIVGFVEAGTAPDPAFEELAYDLRLAWRPPLTRGGVA